MSEFNQCASLCNTKDLLQAETLYTRLLSEGKNPLGYMLELQNSLQETLAGSLGRLKAPRSLRTKGDLYDFVLNQKIAIDDEWREMVEAMAGMSMPEKDRSALWKKWKGKYDEVRGQNVLDMSREDRLELLFEFIDIQHFILNVQLALDISDKDVFIMYCLKQAENVARQERGY